MKTSIIGYVKGIPLVTALLSQISPECPTNGHATLQYTEELCYGYEQVIVIPWVVRLYVEIIHEL